MDKKIDKRVVKFKEFKYMVHAICMDIEEAVDEWMPDYVVGITRGGLVPAVMISHYLKTPMHSLKVSFREGTADLESNCWMAEDAFNGKNILIVDDINDSGETINWIKKDWEGAAFPRDSKWESIWNNNVKIATVFNNIASKALIDVDFYYSKLDKSEKDVWIEFPYENWWDKRL